MNLEEALSIVEAAVWAKTGKQLSEAEETVLRGAWEGKTYEEMAETSAYTVNYLKNDAGPNFWKLLTTEVFREKVSKANLRAVLERQGHSQLGQLPQTQELKVELAHPGSVYLKSGETIAKPLIDWGEAPSLQVFYGRRSELDELKQWIGSCKGKLLVLLGMRGMGKTTLAVKLAEEIKSEFDYVIWRSLDRDPPPPLADILADIIKVLSNQHRSNLPATVDVLIEYLRKHRCLLVLNNGESLMEAGYLAGHYREGYEEYGTLLRRVGTERHQSCLVLTSRENPKEIVELEAKELPVRSLTITGLPEVDARKILVLKELSDEEHWEMLIEIFQGNPLALQIVSAIIKRSFGGRVSDFLKQKTITTRQIVDLVDQQFNDLSALEREIMYWLAIKQQPMSFSELQESIERSGSELLDALESLLRRSLIQGEALFTLDSVVRQYVTNEFAKEKLSLELPHAKDNIRQLLERCFHNT